MNNETTSLGRKSRYTGLVFISAALLLIIVVLAFTGGLNISSFQKKYEESVVFSLVAPTKQTIGKIEYALKYGKELEHFYGLRELIDELLDQLEEVNEVRVLWPNEAIAFNRDNVILRVPIEDTSIIETLRDRHEVATKLENDSVVHDYMLERLENEYLLSVPIYNPHGYWEGSVQLAFDRSVVSTRTGEYLFILLRYLLLLAAFAALILVLTMSRLPITDHAGKLRSKPLLILIIAIMSVIQITYGYINYQLFSRAYINASQEVAVSAAEIISRDIQSVIEKGVPYSDLYQLDTYLQGIIQELPAIEQINLMNEENVLASSEGGRDRIESTMESDYTFEVGLIPDQTGNLPYIHVLLSETAIKTELRMIVLDMVTVLITSILFMIEISILVLLLLSNGLSNGVKKKKEIPRFTQQSPADTTMIRPLSFIFHLALFLSAAFIPIMSKELYEPLWGMSENLIIALPVTIEMFGAGVGVILAASNVDKRGWKPLFLLGALSVAIGMLICSLPSINILGFSLARGLAGFGYGVCFMALRALITSGASGEKQTSGLTSFFVGLYAGINCGIIVGAMLADRIGYHPVFTIGVIIVVLTGLFVLKQMKNTIPIPRKEKNISFGETFNQLGGFVRNKQVVAFLLLIVLPVAACNMFLDYYFPIFADHEGLSTSDVGRAFLVNGLIIVYLAPLFSKLFLKWLGVEKALLMSGLLVALAMVIFGVKGSVLTAIIAVILLGLSDSFGLVAQNKYYLSLKATGQLGTGKAIGYYDNMRKVGQMLGPMIFGGVVLMGQIGIGLLGILFLIMLLFFWVTRFRNDAEQQKRGSGNELSL
ncbi:MFS transporter [Bacillus horti]|nr:MFS transporter [Bacillus horti]